MYYQSNNETTFHEKLPVKRCESPFKIKLFIVQEIAVVIRTVKINFNKIILVQCSKSMALFKLLTLWLRILITLVAVTMPFPLVGSNFGRYKVSSCGGASPLPSHPAVSAQIPDTSAIYLLFVV